MKSTVMLLMLLLLNVALLGQTKEDTVGITKAALDYAEGWYEANGERMERALHPELAKRMVWKDQNGRSQLNQMSAMTLVGSTKRGGGKDTPEANKLKVVRILDIYESAAVARLDMSGWIDYLQLAKWNGEWRIVNVLWELKPKK